jgi:hypothetical protein
MNNFKLVSTLQEQVQQLHLQVLSTHQNQNHPLLEALSERLGCLNYMLRNIERKLLDYYSDTLAYKENIVEEMKKVLNIETKFQVYLNVFNKFFVANLSSSLD